MDKSVLQTTLIIATNIGAAWTLGGQVQALDGRIQANSEAMGELREDVRELRGLLVSHVAGHSHSAKVAAAAADSEAQAK